jgi:hypothetical protein
MGISAKVRAKFSRQSPARSLLSTVETAPRAPGPEHEPEPEPDQRRRHTWSLRSRGAPPHQKRRSPLLSPGTMEQAEDARAGGGEPVSGQRGGDQRDQSRAGSDRREFVSTSIAQARSTSTPPREGNVAGRDRARARARARDRDRDRDRDNPPSQSHSSGDNHHSLRRSSNPASPSNAQSPPDRCRETRSLLEEYEAEPEVHPASSTTPPRPPRGPSSSSSSKPPGSTRKQSLLPQQQADLIRSLLGSGEPSSPLGQESALYDDENSTPSMVSRKVWVKRPGASATLVTILEDHLVDDVRDLILKKYANTLGKSFDSPDVTLRIVPRENRQERTLGPEEPISQVLDGYFPGGQTVDEALVIDVPLRRTPRPSPQSVPRYYQEDERRPPEAASEYFPPMPVPTVPSPHLPGMMPFIRRARDHSPSAASLTLDVGSHDRSRPEPPLPRGGQEIASQRPSPAAPPAHGFSYCDKRPAPVPFPTFWYAPVSLAQSCVVELTNPQINPVLLLSRRLSPRPRHRRRMASPRSNK